MRLGPKGRQVKDRFRAGNAAAFTTKGSAHKKCMQTREHLGVNIIGSQWESAQLFKVGRSP